MIQLTDLELGRSSYMYPYKGTVTKRLYDNYKYHVVYSSDLGISVEIPGFLPLYGLRYMVRRLT